MTILIKWNIKFENKNPKPRAEASELIDSLNLIDVFEETALVWQDLL